jgi:starch-binding outer membrane protein, SusD/RagB family
MKFNKVLAISLSVLSFASCTKLEEKFNSEVATGSGGGAAASASSLLDGAYGKLNNPLTEQNRLWSLMEHTSDELIAPTRGGDWDDNGVWRVLHSHQWDADHAYITATFRELAQIQFAATAVLDATAPAATPSEAAQAKFLRALSMFYLLDGWGQVPFRATTNGDLTTTMPEVKKGADAATFIITDLEAALPNLPAMGATSLATQNACRALLAKVYMNRGVYANPAMPTFAATDMNKAIQYADAILGNSSYALGGNYFDAFTANNDANSEVIYTLRSDKAAGFGGNVQSRFHLTMHYNQFPSGWNGFTTLSDFYNKFQATDKRRGGAYPGLTNRIGLNAGFLVGQQTGPADRLPAGNPDMQLDRDMMGNFILYTDIKDRTGAPLAFTPTVKAIEIGGDLERTGIRVVKYIPELDGMSNPIEFPTNNDYVVFKVSDVALLKAEAILRGGTATTAGVWGNSALSIINYIRTHVSRGVNALGSATLTDVLDERGKELYWEGWRRNDLIRFGKFLEAFQEKAVSGPERLRFPIPNEQLAVNPGLTQNPGY